MSDIPQEKIPVRYTANVYISYERNATYLHHITFRFFPFAVDIPDMHEQWRTSRCLKIKREGTNTANRQVKQRTGTTWPGRECHVLVGISANRQKMIRSNTAPRYAPTFGACGKVIGKTFRLSSKPAELSSC